MGIWLPNFDVLEMHKCYGQIAIGLLENGVDVSIITSGKGKVVGSVPEKLNIITNVNIEDFKNIVSKQDYLIMYTWLSKKFTSHVERASETKVGIIIKCDTMGRVGTNFRLLQPEQKYLLFRPWKAKPFWKWGKIVAKVLLQQIPAIKKIVFEHIVKQFYLAQKVIIESPNASYDLAYVLYELGHPELSKKIIVLPNPVNDVFLNLEVQNQAKRNTVISVARWNDEIQKNPRDLVRALNEFLRLKRNWDAILIGPGENILRKYIEKFVNTENIHKIKVVGKIDNEKLTSYYQQSKIFVSSSRFESSQIAVLEALVSGATAVCPPLEPFFYQTYLGFSGTLALSHKWYHLSAALIHEANMWENGVRNATEISNFWKHKLDRRKIARDLLENLKGDTR